MITQFKIFENLNNVPEIFDNNIYDGVQLQYYNIPKNIQHRFTEIGTTSVHSKYIIEFGKTIEELDMKLAAKKYNL